MKRFILVFILLTSFCFSQYSGWGSGAFTKKAKNETITGDWTFSGGFSVDSPTFYVDKTNDRVGIGTTTPAKTLHLYHPTVSPTMYIGTSSTTSIFDYNSIGTVAASTFSLRVGNDVKVWLRTTGMTVNDGNDNFDFLYNGDTADSVFVCEATGNLIYMVQLGAGAGDETVERDAGTGLLTANASSERYKDNIKDWNIDISNFGKLRPREYDWNENSAIPGKHGYGLIAEEVNEVLPELTYSKKGMIQNWNKDKMITYLIAVIQDQQRQIDDIKTRIK